MRGGGSRGAPGVASREASSPPARLRSSERGGSVSGCSSVARERASVSSTPLGAAEREVARSQRTPPVRAASSVASPHSSQHALRREESSEQGRIVEPALGRTALVTVAVVLAPLTVRS